MNKILKHIYLLLILLGSISSEEITQEARPGMLLNITITESSKIHLFVNTNDFAYLEPRVGILRGEKGKNVELTEHEISYAVTKEQEPPSRYKGQQLFFGIEERPCEQFISHYVYLAKTIQQIEEDHENSFATIHLKYENPDKVEYKISFMMGYSGYHQYNTTQTVQTVPEMGKFIIKQQILFQNYFYIDNPIHVLREHGLIFDKNGIFQSALPKRKMNYFFSTKHQDIYLVLDPGEGYDEKNFSAQAGVIEEPIEVYEINKEQKGSYFYENKPVPTMYYSGYYNTLDNKKGKLFIDIYTGKPSFYYKSKSTEGSILPTSENLITDQFIDLNGNAEIIKVQGAAGNPGKYRFYHIIENYVPSELKVNEKQIFSMNKGETKKITIPAGTKILISTVKKNSMHIVFKEKQTSKTISEYSLDTNHLSAIESFSVESELEINANDAGYVYTYLVKDDKKTYYNIQHPQNKMKYNDMYFELNDLENYEYITITINNIHEDFYYQITSQFGDMILPYMDDQEKTYIKGQQIRKNKWEIRIDNNYLKSIKKHDTQKFFFILSKTFDDTIDFSYHYSNLIYEKDLLVYNTTGVLSDKGYDFSRKEYLIQKESDLTKELVVVSAKYGKKISNLHSKTFGSDDYNIVRYNNRNRIKVSIIENHNVDMYFEPKYNTQNAGHYCIEMFYFYKSIYNEFDKSLYEGISTEYYKIEFSNNKITWPKLKKFNNVKYELYIFKNLNDIFDNDYVNNDCYLIRQKSLYKNNEGSDLEQFVELSKDTTEYEYKKNDKVNINIVAVIQDDTKFRVVYQGLYSDSSKKKKNLAAILGSLGGAIALVLIIILVVCLARKCKKEKSFEQLEDDVNSLSKNIINPNELSQENIEDGEKGK